jgi:NAD(P)-dependent dehydrogenase (short-subunit alcohol dehydrogenase family)
MALVIDLSQRRALVTGVSSGIGAGIARALAQAGCDVVGCGLEAATSDGAQAFLAEVSTLGRCGFYQQADVSAAAQARGVATWAAEQLGGLDIVVSNAGRNVFRGATACNDADWQANLDLNLAAHWRVAQAAQPLLMQGTQPVIVVIASNHAYSTTPGSFPYNVAKAGLVALVQSLAIEWGPTIRAVGVAPGFINTPLAEKWFSDFPDPQAKYAEIADLHPVRRLGSVDEIGALCAFLASPLASFISGSTVLADGGRSALMQDR